jgi:hypothetical protein
LLQKNGLGVNGQMVSNVLARKYVPLLTAAIIVLVLIVSSGARAYADSQASSTVSLQYFTVQGQYPATVMPGANALVHIQAVAKSAANLNSLNTLVYYNIIIERYTESKNTSNLL